MGWLYVPGSEDSSSDSDSPVDGIGAWVTSSGTPSLRPASWPGWKRRPWIARLSGTISRPSTASRIADLLISSARAFHVSPSATPESSADPTTSDGSGPTSREWFARFDRASSSWRTCQVSWLTDLETYSATWPRAGTMRSGMSSERPTSGRRTFASGSSYSRGEYPTPSATPYGTSQNEGKVPHPRPSAATPGLARWAKGWPTPVSGDGHKVSSPRRDGDRTLESEARGWPTPTAHDGRRPGAELSSTQGANLKREAIRWPTPIAADDGHKVSSGNQRDGLKQRIERWATPNTRDSASSARETTDPELPMHGGRSLTDDIRRWMTPTARDRKDGAAKDSAEPTNSRLGLQALRTEPDGKPTSPKAVLNPLFVEVLMGFPTGWTDSRPSGTPSYRWPLRSRSESSR